MSSLLHKDLSLEECNPETIQLPGEEPPVKRHRKADQIFHELGRSNRRGDGNTVEIVTIEEETRLRNSVSWAERISNIKKIVTGVFCIKKYPCAD